MEKSFGIDKLSQSFGFGLPEGVHTEDSRKLKVFGKKEE